MGGADSGPAGRMRAARAGDREGPMSFVERIIIVCICLLPSYQLLSFDLHITSPEGEDAGDFL